MSSSCGSGTTSIRWPHGANISRELRATEKLDRALGEWHERLAEVRGVVVDADRLLRGLPRLAREEEAEA